MTRAIHPLGRRRFLKAAGGVAIGLPVLHGLDGREARARAPVRAINLFFGLGVPKEIQSEGLTGPLEPLSEFADKLAWVRGVNLYEADGSANNHFDGGGGVFCGVEPRSDAASGGPSIDQALKADERLPNDMIPTLAMGSFFRRSRLTRYVHNWNFDGSPAALPREDPRDLFDRVFGQLEPDDGINERDRKLERYRRSVLDAVIGQVRTLKSPAAGLGPEAVRTVDEHLERIREYELRVFRPNEEPDPSDSTAACEAPNRPAVVPLLHGQQPDPDGEGVDLDLEEWVTHWRLLADLFVLAFKCDRVRFGGAMFQSAGERIRLKGLYRYQGQTVYDFDDRRDRGRGGAQGCSHEFWHRYRRDRDNPEMRHHTHFIMAQVAYLLRELDRVESSPGRSLLDDTLVTISTELGDGNPHNLESVFHAVSSAGDRFRPGTYDVEAEGLDLYNTILEAYGSSRRLGPNGRSLQRVEAILA